MGSRGRYFHLCLHLFHLFLYFGYQEWNSSQGSLIEEFQECLLPPNHWAAVAVNNIDNHYIVPFVFVELKDLLDLTNDKDTNSTFLNADDRKREWEMFVSKEINKPF